MIYTEKKEVVHTAYKEVPISGVCDICGKELLPVDKSKLDQCYRGDRNIYDYYRITTHHHDWGNDSVDSYEYTDCCCVDCALMFIQKYWKDCTKGKPWPTLELEMRHEYELTDHY